MKTPAIVQRHPELRWLVSVLLIVAVVIALATTVSGVFRTDSVLPATSPEQLTAQVQEPHAEGYSGTIIARAELALPESLRSALSATVPVGGSLLSGSHTIRYWYGGPALQRVAVLGQNGEQDVFRNGSQVLTWDTRTHVAQRAVVTDQNYGALPLSLAAPSALTPPQLAAQLLDLAGTTSDTTLRSGDPIAGRSIYELVVRPDAATSRISEVHIEIDGREAVPLGVQVFTKGEDTAALDVRFQAISFAAPVSRNFTFTPPVGAELRTGSAPALFPGGLGAVTTVGTGWTSVASYRTTPVIASRVADALGRDLKPVKGRWGSGRLLDTPLLCVLVTAKGRLLAGAVEPSVLYRVAA